MTDQVRTEKPHIGTCRLEGDFVAPAGARGLVVFAHGSGSSRLSPRNTYVAEALQRRGFATLLFDLLTETEAADRRNVFDIPLLAARIHEALDWARAAAPDLDLCLFGASTGAAAALIAAAQAPDITAVVSRGGRPDLAGDSLGQVRAPVLLIVGGADRTVLDLNRAALERIDGPKRLEVVPAATHLFEEPGALDAVIDHAGDWFDRHTSMDRMRRVSRSEE